MRDPKVRLRRLSEIATNPPPGGLLCFLGTRSGKDEQICAGSFEFARAAILGPHPRLAQDTRRGCSQRLQRRLWRRPARPIMRGWIAWTPYDFYRHWSPQGQILERP